ncbi:DUF4190 domain-containing protein [Amycolatopsis taiwanensis]|uniref:DUF4190 domain-containing protein n=1 Tax=Amycolatopsis taiwanensis TaxID=342230 RepID=UPI0004869214|nr:DUF4190 domain-containing protein [Amycolatopsis taiwanensis]
MTQPAPYPPVQQEEPTQPRNGFGTTGFILGLVGLVLSPIPLIGFVAWPLVILGLIFAALGLSRVSKGAATNKGLSIAGIVTSIVGLIVCIVWVTVINKAVNDVREEANQPTTVVYEVTGDATDVSIDYTTFGETTTSDSETTATLPWTKEVQTKGLLTGGSLIVTTGDKGGSATCKVTVNGTVAKTSTARGPFAIADCTGF